MITMTCLRTNLTKAERKEYFERARAEYEKKLSEGRQIPYEDFSDWRAEQFKSERSCGWRDFLHADDGWITIPEISNVRMDSYEIEINPAGGMTLLVSDPKRYDPEVLSHNYGHILPYFNEKTFPKFAAVPEKERVLYADFTKQCNIPAGTLNASYEEARFFLATFKIIMDHWPEFSAALGCGYGGDGPVYKGSYYGFLRNLCLLWMDGFTDPPLKKTKTSRMLSALTFLNAAGNSSAAI
ncbi:MAG: hypothetical protein WBS54_13205 [Acidobacteriota bacterium]